MCNVVLTGVLVQSNSTIASNNSPAAEVSNTLAAAETNSLPYIYIYIYKLIFIIYNFRYRGNGSHICTCLLQLAEHHGSLQLARLSQQTV